MTLFEITTVIVVVVAHCPAVGVKVYTVDPTIVVFITEGFQVPVIGGVLFELVGNGSGTALRQYGPNCAKVGVTGAVMVMVIVVVVAHCPAAGVKVYVCIPTVEVLIVDGDHVPVIGGELVELVGNVPGIAFWQYGPNCVNVGVTGAVIVMVIVVVVAHCPAVGVKVYVCIPTVEVLIVDGDHVPMIGGELVELVGKVPGVSFWQYGPNCVNVGVTGAVMVMIMVVVVAHCPAAGVKVYVCIPTVDVLIVDGDHVPVIGGVLLELVGKVPGVAFWQYGPNCVNVGVTGAVIVMVIVVVVAHWPAVGVKVYVCIPTVDVLIVDGDQVPVIGGELLELVGKVPGVAFWQYGPNCVNVGVTGVVTVTVTWADEVHPGVLVTVTV
jgi:predicted peroxiredoxin